MYFSCMGGLFFPFFESFVLGLRFAPLPRRKSARNAKKNAAPTIVVMPSARRSLDTLSVK